MHDLKRIKDLQAQQENLVNNYEALDAILDDLQSLRKKQEFIPSEMNSSIRDMLSKIRENQNSFISGYEALEFGETPTTVTDCKAELDDYEKYILEKSSYVEVINFVLALDSDNAAAKSALEQHQAFASAYNCRINSVAQCEADLKKYILLKEAFEEKDPTKRLSDIIELSPMIDFPLVVALNTNALTHAGKAPAAKEYAYEPVAAESNDQAPAKEIPVPDEKPVPSETLPVEKEREEVEDFWTPDNFQMPDFKVPQKPISNRPAPDEAPISHAGIESGLTAELNHVLSRENAAHRLAADVEHTASLPNVKSAPQAVENTKAWENLGVYNPAAVCYSVPDEKMQIFRCERPKKFSVSDFQKELSLKVPNRFTKQCAIKDAYKYGATSPHMLAELIKEDSDLVEDACDTLVDNGYLKAFELSGRQFERFERLYVLTASGRKVFTNNETASLLNLAAVEKTATPPFASHANAVLNRMLFLTSKKLMELYMPSRQFVVGSFILETNSFINFFPTTNGTGTYSYVSVLGNELKDYLIFKVELQELLPTLNTISVVGMTEQHAKALAGWIYDSFRKELAGKKLQCYVYETDTYYTFPEGVPFKIG